MADPAQRLCAAATSPLAYLADLLGYVTKHMKDGAAALTSSTLTAKLHQPFADLPSACVCMDRQVSEARIAVDVLRSYLRARGLPVSGSPAQVASNEAETSYRLGVYDTLLRQIGTSFDELRVLRTGSPDERAALADRLGIDAGKLAALPVDSQQLTEAMLEALFGLAETGRDPLSEGAKSGDAQRQVTRWNLDGVAWGRNTDPDGLIHLRLKKESNAFQVMLFRDAGRTQPVAGGLRATNAGLVTLAAIAGSGLSGALTIQYAADSNAIAIAAVPAVLAWRLARLRAQWLQQDAVTDGYPIVDPDLVAQTDLRNPTAGDATFQVWKSRREFVDARVAELRALRQSAPKELAGLDAILAKAKVSPQILQALAARLTNGENIITDIEALRLSPGAFSFLVRIRQLAQSHTAVLDAEWTDVQSILAQALKRDAFAAWRAEEQQRQICLSPDSFLAAGSEPALTPWRADAAARQEWATTLQARCDQEQSVMTAWQASLRAAEQAALPALRDALVLASDAQGDNLAAKARWITDRLLIDAQGGPGQFKTRASQAIETIQGLITSARTGQLGDTHPTLTLAADRFDEEWEWLGSYATWRAALLVYLCPENLLLPALRRRQTPAFQALVSELQAGRRISPTQVRAAATGYEDYFRDVCSLLIETSCLAETRKEPGGTDELFYQFAIGAKTKAIYWSASGAAMGATFWEALVKPAGFVKLVAAVPFATDEEDKRFVFLFAQVSDKGKPGLAFLRYDLDERGFDTEWTVLDLPAERGGHEIVAVQNQNAEEAPSFFIRAPDGMYVRALDQQGAGWETPGRDEDATSDWKAFRVPGYPTGTTRLCAALRTVNQEPGSYWLCRQVQNKGIVVVKQADVPAAPKIAPGGGPVEMGGARASFVGAFPRGIAGEIVVLYRASPRPGQSSDGPGGRPRAQASRVKEITWRIIRTGQAGTDHIAAALNGLQRLAPRFDSDLDPERQAAWQKTGERLRSVFSIAGDTFTVKNPVRIAPKVDQVIPIMENGPAIDQNARRAGIQAAVVGNATAESNLAYVAEAFYFVPVHLAMQLQARGHFISALDWFRTVYDYRLRIGLRKIYHGLKLEETQAAVPATLVRPLDWLLDPLNPHAIAAARAGSYSRGTLLTLVACFLEFADAEFTRDTSESLPRARTLYLTALELLDTPDLAKAGPQRLATPLPGPSGEFEVPPNGLLAALRFRAELNLFKLRTGRNIAGLERQIEPYAAPADADGALPGIGVGGQLTVPGAQTLRPTPYRYPLLIERAKQLAQLAGQMEAAMLSAFEKRDAELYSLLKARQDVKLTRAGVRLQDLRVREAENGVRLAELQQQRAQIQERHFAALLEQGIGGMSALELASLATLGAVATGFGVASVVAAIAKRVTDSLELAAKSLETSSAVLSQLASYERRKQDWELQELLASQDVAIGTQQIRLANDHERIAGQERVIADLQADHAEASLDFLAGKFTSAELFDWMSGVLEGVYSFFLQQATAVAKLAENQLAFERQATPPALIQADYWEALTDGGALGVSEGATSDRRGLTGSARLLQDIFRLDQHAFDTDKRKLQLTRTFSLSRMAPAEFQQFRESGTMLFATPMELFDRDFPGHYLRLVKRVRMSVIALIPSAEGIRATLSTPGVSRVTTGGDGAFQTIVVSQGPQSVALTAPQNASGLFELDLQPEMLLPFEGIGVDTVWRLELPKAANPFDYGTIADVLLTIEYTALASPDLRRQVIQSLPRALSSDRPFSFRHQFPNAWYDLHNPEQTTTPMTIRFATQRDDFAPNLEQLKIQHVILFFSRASGRSFEVQNAQLRFSAPGDASPVGGEASSIDGIISTRRGNAGNWQTMQTKAPVGSWELTLPNTAEMKGRFKNEEIDDILLVLTYSGRTPDWPA